MLWARDVLSAASNYLEQSEGCEFVARWPLNAVANHPDRTRILLSAYGENLPIASNNKRQEGRVMDEDETRVCVSCAYHAAGCKLSKECQEGDVVVMAFPHTHSFWKYLRPLKGALDQLGIRVLLVRGDLSVVEMTQAPISSEAAAP